MKELTPEEKWERATIANNFIFYKVMRNNPKICKRLLEILLEMEIEKIQIYQEETVDIDFQSKGIRLDVYAKNSTQAFNVEMQATDTRELPERARYYQSAMDIDCLKSGQQYKELKDTYVIFICLEDIFGQGLAKYSFENICREAKELKLNDRSYKYFFIARNCDKLLNEEQKAFLKLVTSNESRSDFASQIQALVEAAKYNFQWKRQYMDLEREKTYAYVHGKEEGLAEGHEKGLKEGKELGLKEGAHENAIANARNLLKMNIGTVEQISKAIGLSVEEILKLKDELK